MIPNLLLAVISFNDLHAFKTWSDSNHSRWFAFPISTYLHCLFSILNAAWFLAATKTAHVPRIDKLPCKISMGTCIYALCRSSLIGVYISWSLSTSSQTLLQKCLFQFKRARHLVTQCFKPKTEVTSYRSYPCVPCLNSHSSLLVAVKVLQASQIPSDVARKFVKPWSAELWKNLSYLWWIFQIWGGCLGLQIAWNHWDCDNLV